jgi:hypothetical protein
MNNKEYIRQRIIERFPQNQLQAQSISRAVAIEGGSSFATKFLAVAIFGLFLLMAFLLFSKHMGVDLLAQWRSNESVARQMQPVQSIQPAPIIRESKYDDSAIIARLGEIERKQEVWYHRIWLLALAHNENANLSQFIDRRYHPNSTERYITFDNQWRFNKIPSTIGLTEEQKRNLEISK